MFVVVAGETKTLVVLEVRAWRDQTLAARQQFRHDSLRGISKSSSSTVKSDATKKQSDATKKRKR